MPEVFDGFRRDDVRFKVCGGTAVVLQETKRVNEAVKNNPRKFPDVYLLTLTEEVSA